MFTCVSKSEFTYPISPARPKKHLGQPFFWLGTHQVQKNKLSVGCSPNKKFTSNKLGPGSSYKWAYDSTYRGYDSLVSPFIFLDQPAPTLVVGWFWLILTWEVLDDSGETLRIEIVAVNQLARALMSLFVVLPKNLGKPHKFKKGCDKLVREKKSKLFICCFFLGLLLDVFLFFCWGGIWGRKGLHRVVFPRKSRGNRGPRVRRKLHQDSPALFWCKSSWHTKSSQNGIINQTITMTIDISGSL